MTTAMEVKTSWTSSLHDPNKNAITSTTITARHSYHSGMSYSSSSDSIDKTKRSANHCDLCGKRLLKLAGWRNYFTLPCRYRHMFCKQCITDRLQCRQKVMGSASFDIMWTFPCPRSAQCGQQLTVDWSRGRSYSKNLVARDLSNRENDFREMDVKYTGGGGRSDGHEINMSNNVFSVCDQHSAEAVPKIS